MSCSPKAQWIALCVCAAACVKNPATGERQLNFVSRDQEIAMGQQGATEVAQSIGLYDDPALQKYVSELGQKLVQVSERPKLPWHFAVVDDPAVNAFALPGGYIFITRGILAHLENEAQLATVMGHEVGHVTAEHSVNQMSKEQLAQLGLGVGMAISPTMRQLGQLGMAGMQLMFLKFGRDDERQADALGFRYALRAGYDVREMPKVFAMLEQVSKKSAGSARLPGWLATHPDPEERVARSEKRVRDAKEPLQGLKVGDASMLHAIDGMVYGDDPREGYFEGSHFCQPTMGFCVDFPQGFQTLNTKQAVLAQSPQEDAIIELSAGENMAPEAALEAFFSQSGATPTSQSQRVGNAVAASFQADSDQGSVAGLVAFMSDQGHTYRVLGLSDPNSIGSYASDFTATIRSFRQMDDSERARAKQPLRVHVETLSQPMSVAQLQAAHSALKVEDLALLNQVDQEYVFPAGRLVKWVGPERVSTTGKLVGMR